jgi:endonuclease G
LALGNPSQAVTDVGTPNNYLMEKTQYALAYDNSRGSAKWVGWHLSGAWKGGTARQDDFRADTDLPSGFYRAGSTSYSGTGFDRGHICPSDDRDSSITDNSSTFLMTNMLPQAPNLNRIVWANFESYCRSLMDSDHELYIFSGGYGQGGEGTNGTANTIANGKIVVPSHCWKVALVLPIGDNDISRIDANTRVIAVDMPNTQMANQSDWRDYRVSTDFVELVTGLDFFSEVPTGTQSVIESRIDTQQ